MRVFLQEQWTLPDAVTWQLDHAFDTFDDGVQRHRDLAAQISDLLLATNLRERQLIFTGFLDLPGGQAPYYYVHQAQRSIGALSAALAWDWGLPYIGSTSRLTLRSGDNAFTAQSVTTYGRKAS